MLIRSKKMRKANISQSESSRHEALTGRKVQKKLIRSSKYSMKNSLADPGDKIVLIRLHQVRKANISHRESLRNI